MLKGTNPRFINQKTLASPRVGAQVRRGVNSVDIHIPAEERTVLALLTAVKALVEGKDVTIRVNDAGVAPGRLVITTEKVGA